MKAREIPTNVSLEVNGTTHDVDLVGNDLHIDENNLNEEYIKQAGTYAWYGVMCAEAEALRDTTKYELENLYAELDKQVRIELELRGDKVTEKLVDQEILRKQEYQDKREELIEANRQLNVMKAIKESLNHKKDMLISLGANLRSEIDSAVTIRDREEEPTGTPRKKATAVKDKIKKRKQRKGDE